MRGCSNALSLLLLLVAGCVVSTGPEGTAQNDNALATDAGAGCHEHVILALQGVTCPSCREVIVASLMSLHGVVSAQVSLSPQEADVVYCDTLDTDDLVSAVQKAGYEASVKK